MTLDYKGYTVVDICRGNNPFGLVGNRCLGGNDIILTPKTIKQAAKIYSQRMIVETDNFDRKNTIEIGNSLYCNTSGVLSSKRPFENSIVLAKVISPASNEKKHMQILWL